MAEGFKPADTGRQQRDKWCRLMKETVDADEWGQTLEAMEGYERLLNLLNFSTKHDVATAHELHTISTIRKSIDCRLGFLKTGTDGIPIKELKGVLEKVESLFTDEGPKEKPVSANTSPTKQTKALAPSSPQQPSTKIRLLIQQIGLKDAAAYNEPRIVVSVVNRDGTLVAPSEESGISTQRSQSYIIFQKQMVLAVRYEDLLPGSAIVFEFKHVKKTPTSEKLSTKCWAFMDVDEVKPDTDIALELYKKPTDLLRKRLRLHTIKHLYLHLRLTFESE